jgi:Tfp pilus assembly protein PilN
VSQQINLFNPIFLKQKKHFSARTMLQGLGMIFLGSVAVVIYAQWQLSSLNAEAAATANRLKATQDQLTRVVTEYAPKKKSSTLETEISQVEADLQARRQVIEQVQKGDLGNTKGYSAYFRALSQQIIDGLWLTGFRIDGGALELRGRALRPELVPEYIARLGREPVMKGKSFSTLEMHVPLVDKPVKNDGAASASAGTQQVPANYIEFRLRSAESASARADAATTNASGATADITEAGVARK